MPLPQASDRLIQYRISLNLHSLRLWTLPRNIMFPCVFLLNFLFLKHLLIIPIHFVLCFTVSGAGVIVLCIGVLSCRITVFVLLFITAGALCHRFAHHHGIISRRVQ